MFLAVQSNRLLQETCFSSRGEIMEKSKMTLVDLPNTEYKKCFQKFNKMLSVRITSKRPISIFMNNFVTAISDVSSKLLFLKLHFPCIRLNRVKFPDPLINPTSDSHSMPLHCKIVATWGSSQQNPLILYRYFEVTYTHFKSEF